MAEAPAHCLRDFQHSVGALSHRGLAKKSCWFLMFWVLRHFWQVAVTVTFICLFFGRGVANLYFCWLFVTLPLAFPTKFCAGAFVQLCTLLETRLFFFHSLKFQCSWALKATLKWWQCMWIMQAVFFSTDDTPKSNNSFSTFLCFSNASSDSSTKYRALKQQW